MKQSLDYSVQKLLTSIKEQVNGQTIYCGLSAGADSTCLFDILNKKKEYFKFELKAVFFSHGSSPIALDEDIMLNHCEALCLQNNVQLIINDLDLKVINNQGWESSGRIMRQDFYSSVNAKFVFLGHHEDDQNETTLTQLFRGGASRGAAAMNEVDGIYYRPFLNHRKSEIYQYLKDNNISWVEDPTNNDTDFTRNFWRKEGLPTIEKHYPDYSKRLNNFRSQLNDLHAIAYEMALNDGLKEFLESDFCINVKDMSDVRFKNLVKHFFQVQKINFTDKQYNEFSKNYYNNVVREISKNDVSLYFYSNVLSNNKDLLPKPKEKKSKKPS